MELSHHVKVWWTSLAVASLGTLSAQNISYTVDPDFSTGEMLRGGGAVQDIVPLDDGGYLLGGGILTMFANPSSPFPYGSGMITADGELHPDWEMWGNSGFVRELHDHQGGYIYSAEIGQIIAKMTYTGMNWSVAHGETWGDYFKLSNAFYSNPYEVRWAWDVFILENEKVLIGGAIATDTLQPNLFRHLTRVLPDGTHDDAFPIVEAMPQNLSTHVSKIERAGDGSWYVSGNFEGISGHISPHIAKLDANFQVDTSFVSPLSYVSISFGLHTELKYFDEEERLWIGGITVQLEAEPDEEYHLVRLLPDGQIDPSFAHAKLSSEAWNYGWERPTSVYNVIKNPQGNYVVLGSFSHYNDTSQLCITAIDDAGTIQNNYFQGNGPSTYQYDPDVETNLKRPSLDECIILENGDLLLGGAFSDFMGVERYGMVRLNQGILNTQKTDVPIVNMYPNPTRAIVRWDIQAKEVEVYNTLGIEMLHKSVSGNSRHLDVSELPCGMYHIRFLTDQGNAVKKLIIQ